MAHRYVQDGREDCKENQRHGVAAGKRKTPEASSGSAALSAEQMLKQLTPAQRRRMSDAVRGSRTPMCNTASDVINATLGMGRTWVSPEEFTAPLTLATDP